MHCLRLTTLAVLAFLASRAYAIDNKAPRPRLKVPHTTLQPQIDASPDDPAWQSAAVIPNLTPSLGYNPGQRPIPPTSVQVLWDEQCLYVRFRCTDAEIYSPIEGHDAPLYKADVVELFIDPVGDGRQFVEVEISPRNSVLDMLHLITTKPKYNPDLTLRPDVIDRNAWSCLDWTYDGLRSATSQWSENGKTAGWIVDLALPARPLLKRMGFKTFRPQNLRINFLRYESEAGATPKAAREFIPLNWAPVVVGRPHRSPAAMGYLRLMPGPDDRNP
jgi:hypothetical protein